MKAVNTACCEQGVRSLPQDLPEGAFQFVKETDNTRIYRYKFLKRKGCRAVDMAFHGRLPVLTDNKLEAIKLLEYRTNDLSGLAYLMSEGDGEKLHTVDVMNGKIMCTYTYEKGRDTELPKDTVKKRLLEHINRSCSACVASCTPKTDCVLSEFKGGEDIILQLDSSEAVLTLGLGGACGVVGDEDTDDDTESSTVYGDEVRSGLEDVKHIELQLRANMMLCLARKLDNMLRKYSLADLKLLNAMSIYGVTFGYHSLHLLLKLTVDFKNRTTTTKVRFRSGESMQWAVEASVGYIISKMRAKSVASATSTPSTTPTPPPS